MADTDIQLVVRKRGGGGVVFEGNVFAVSSINKIGPFDILAKHANFVTEIQEKLVIHKDKKNIKEIILDSGLLSARSNLVEVFLGI